jgi:hypothetical protein
MVERHGYEYARRKGIVSMVGGKRKTEIRNATPPAFRDVLLSIAATAAPKGPVDYEVTGPRGAISWQEPVGEMRGPEA